MGQINKIPLGYLNMLGSQTGGKNPFTAAEVVTPAVEMIPFYHAQAMANQFVALAYTTNLADIAEVTVPSDESWFLYAAGVTVLTLGASDRARFNISLVRLPKTSLASDSLIWMTQNLTAISTLGQMGEEKIFSVPIPITAGTIIRATMVDHTNNRTAQFSYLTAVFKS